MIRFTKHALDKFEILKRLGFVVSRDMVEKTAKHPDILDHSRSPLIISQRPFDKDHVLRVVYKIESGVKHIITFYPGRKSQYEKE